MAMMSSMNPYNDASVDVMSTARGSVSICLVDCFLSSCGSKDMCGEFRSSLYQYSSWGRSFYRSIVASLKVVYYAGAGVSVEWKRLPLFQLLSSISNSFAVNIALYIRYC